MSKYIFLDIDGVLNCGIGPYSFLHREKVGMLSEVVHKTGAQIVLISSWKKEWFKHDKKSNGTHAKILDSIFAEYNIEVIDKTENNSWQRGKSIIDYLKNHPAENWIIFDDDIFPDYINTGCVTHLVRTDFATGLTPDSCKKAIEMLNIAQTN
jgi:hypothetical protein